MSEPIPESIPTSMDPRSKRPQKKRQLKPVESQSQAIETLFKKPDRPINIEPPKPKTLPPPAEIVANVQGSSAGAGSGEFHVYKASRRREMERVKMMEEEVKRDQEMQEFERKKEELRLKEEARTAKNRAKRMKKKGKAGGAKEKEQKGEEQGVKKPDGEAGPAQNGTKESKAVTPAPEEENVIIHDED